MRAHQWMRAHHWMRRLPALGVPAAGEQFTAGADTVAPARSQDA
ncbi:hypothetical protein ACIOEZ_18165 [Streptomyces sp. NPDC087866]